MRSIHTAKAGNKYKRDYYTKDKSLGSGQKSYYGQGEAKSQSAEMTEAVWFGKDAERLNLRGYAQQQDFEQIYDGYIPGTNQRIRGEKPRDDHKENCLYDLVLTCKKSVSMQIHLSNDDRLYKAYQETVLEIAELIQNDYAQARIQTNGDRQIVSTEGIIALLMPHHTTRDNDMGVHTHLLIANGTYCEDGKWRSLLDRGFSHAYYMGDYFSARMAARVQELGYEIRETVTEEGHPSWELAGYSDEQIKVFSKRSENVEVKELIAQGYSRDDALLVTRKAKEIDETIEQMQERWGAEAHEHDIGVMIPKRYAIAPKRNATAGQVLESAIRHYSYRSVRFTRDQIREYAFKLNRTFTIADLDQAIAKHPELIDYGKIRGVEELHGHFTTVKAVEREIRTVKAWMAGQQKVKAILDRATSTQALEDIRRLTGERPLKLGQLGAVVGVLASTNQHQVIHGLSGVGKTTALRQLKALLDSQGIEVLGLAPSIPAAEKLGEELDIETETQTVQKFIRSNIPLKRGQFIVIDESGMDSADMLDVVLQKVNEAGARVLLVGDTKQNQAIEAGSPMRSVMVHGAETHHISEIIRQQNSIQKQAVELIANGKGVDAISLLREHGYITPIEEREERVKAIAGEYLSLSEAQRNRTLIVTGTNAEKDAITTEIREGLKRLGFLGESAQVKRIDGVKISAKDAKDIQNYRVGSELVLRRGQEKTSTSQKDPYRVVAVEGNSVVLLRPSTDTLYRYVPEHQKLATSVGVTQLRDRGLTPEQTQEILFYRVGDYVIPTVDYKRVPLQRNTPYQFVAKEGDDLVLSTAGGQLVRLNPQHCKEKKVFSAHEFDIAVGDTLRWTNSNRDKGEINGKKIQIAAIEGHIATAITEKGQEIKLNLKKPLAVDHTLVSTSYRIQGSDDLGVLVSATNDPTSNQEALYVKISRQIKFLKIWTEDYDALLRRVAESSAQANPLELIDYVGQNRSSESLERSASRESGYEPDRRDSGDAALGADSRPVAGQPVFINRNDGENGQVARSNGRDYERFDEASQREERDLLVSRTDRVKDGREYSNSEGAKRETGLPDFTIRATDGLKAIADEIVRIRLHRELAAPLSRLASKLEELKELKKLHVEKQALNEAGFQQFLAQAKVEVLDTTLTEWRSLRQEPDVFQRPELAIAPSEVAELTRLLENFPAQTAIQYAMEEYYDASDQVVDMKASVKTGLPVFKLEEGLGSELNHSMNTRPTDKTVDPPKRKVRSPGARVSDRPAHIQQPPTLNNRPQKVGITPKPTKIESFWVPEYQESDRPDRIDEKHWDEWVDSRVHPEIIKDRLQSIEGHQVIERLLEKKLEFLGSFRKVGKEWIRRKIGSQHANSDQRDEMDRYQSVADGGGWWVDSGDDPRAFPDLQSSDKPLRSSYGTFKPNNPRIDHEKTAQKRRKDPDAASAVIKYENPVGIKQELFERDLSFNHVPDAIAAQILEKYGVVQTSEEKEFGFWYTAWMHPEIPIYRVEGDKKDAAVTSQGRVVVSGQGVNAGYRSKDQNDVKLPERVLHPQLAMFAVPGREFRYAFDADENVNAILNVRRDMVREAELVEARGSRAYTIPWKPEQGKGVDDLIKISGPLAFEKADQNAKPIESAAKIHYRTEYNRIARQVRKEKPDISAEHLDIEVYLRAIAKGEPKDGDRFLSQSDQARSLKDPNQVQAYIDHIKASTPQYLQQQRELAAAKAQQVQDRAQYEALSQRVGNAPIEQSAQVIDMQVYLLAESEGNPGNGDRIIAQSNQARLLTNPQEVQAYIGRIKTEALQYEQQIETARANTTQRTSAQADAEKQAIAQATERAQRDGDRALYLTTANEVAQTLGDIPTEQIDVAVYRKISEMAHDPNRVLAQSDHALTLNHPNDVKAYVERLKDLGLEQVEFQAEEQRKLNIRAMGSGSHLLSFLAQQDATGWRRMTIAEYTFSGTEGYFSVDHRDRGNILKVENEQLTANVTVEDVKKFEKAIANIRDTHRKLNRSKVNRSSGLEMGD
jgi:conjugative relaxase-like TrwC/TraI family protein